MNNYYKNIFIEDKGAKESYTSKRRGPGFMVPKRNRIEHGTKLLSQLEKIRNNNISTATSIVKNHGTYIEFESSPNLDLKLSSLESLKNGIKLLNVRKLGKKDENIITMATVFVPKDKEQYFIKKITEYLNENTKTSKNPKNNDLVASIDNIKNALIKSFWCGKLEEIPDENKKWCELWISDDTDISEAEFKNTLESLDIEYKNQVLTFPERKVILANINNSDITNIIENSNLLAEIRKHSDPASFFVELPNNEQAEWVNDLLSRVSYQDSNDKVLILDTGVNNGHKLINPITKDDSLQAFNSEWGCYDHDGHGTSMSGISIYGNLEEKLSSDNQYKIDFGLESYKILPPKGQNDKNLYGSITIEGISSFILMNPSCRRTICLAVTEQEENNDGTPSSWSAAIDETTSGAIDEIYKLALISGGNVQVKDYPNDNKLAAIQSPAQSWNALTIGAYTNNVNFDVSKRNGYRVVAPAGGLSPYSRTSVLWDNKWPIKPEILFEGGNAITNGDGNIYQTDELEKITTHYKPQENQFINFAGTSCATALATNMAVTLQRMYKEAWPETIRGLMVHSASWTEEMKKQFLLGNGKKDYRLLLRTCGYGVPDLNRAIHCANNSVNLIVQSDIQPFKLEDGRIKTKEMNIHEIPWPKEVLEELFDKKIEMKVTLSYFIEPSPGSIGWKDKYKYPSCNLRFEVNGNSTREEFLRKISKIISEEENDGSEIKVSTTNWTLGPNNRNVGSIHSDTWIGTGAELSTSNYIAVFPSSGWWKERKKMHCYDKSIRYSLIISLKTDDQKVDLYTPIIVKIKNKIPILINKD